MTVTIETSEWVSIQEVARAIDNYFGKEVVLNEVVLNIGGAKQNAEPTDWIYSEFLALLTPEKLSALKVLLAPAATPRR